MNNNKKPIIFRDEISNMPITCDFHKLTNREKALLLTMKWCNSPAANKDRYEFDSVIEMSKKLYDYLV